MEVGTISGEARAAGPAGGARTLVLPCVAILLVYTVIFVAPQIVQTLVDDEGFSRQAAGLLMTSFSLTYCLGGIPAGTLTRRHGATRVLVGGMALAGVAGALSALSANLVLLVVLRLAIGLATALVLTAGIVRVVETLPAERRPSGVGWITVSAYVGVGIVNLLTPPLLGPLGWRGVVLAYGIVTLGGALLFLRSARPGAIAVDDRAPSAPIGEVLRDRRLQLVCAMLFLTLAALYGPLAWIPPFMEDVAGFDEGQRSLAGAVMALAAIPGALASGIASRRFGRPALVAAGCLLLCVPVAALALELGQRLPVLIAASALLVAGANGATMPLFSLAPAVVRPGTEETAAGLATTIGLAGSVVAAQAGAVMIDVAGYPLAFAVFGAAGLAGAALALPLHRSLRDAAAS